MRAPHLRAQLSGCRKAGTALLGAAAVMSAGECCDWESAGSELQSWQGLEDWVAIRLHLHCSALSTAAPPNFCSRVCSPESPAFSPSP